MILWNNIKHYTVYRRMFSSYIILVSVTVTLIAAILFQMFSMSSVMEINRISLSMLSQTSYASDIIYDQVMSIGNELLHDNTIITAMLQKEKSPIVDYQAVLKLTYIQAVYPFINYISVYNGNIDRYLNYKGISMKMDSNVIKKIKSNDGSKYFEFFPREASIETGAGIFTSYNVLTFIFYSNFSNLIPKNGALIINISEKELIHKTIYGMSNSNPNDTIFVVNSNGIVLSHSDPNAFLQDFSHEHYMQSILSKSERSGYLIDTIGNEKQLITYVKSDEKKMGWIFVSTKPYNQLLSNIHKMRNTTLIIALMLILLGILFSIFLTGKLYDPLISLVKKINMLANHISDKKKYNEYDMLSETFLETFDRATTMENSLKSAFPVLKETYLNSLLKGNPGELQGRTAININLETQLSGPYFCVLVLKIDGYEDFEQNNSYKDQTLLRFAICNIAQELMEKHCQNNAINTEKQHIILLLQLKTGELPEDVPFTLIEIQNMIKQYFKLSISIGIGNIVNSKDALPESYNSAMDLIKYRLFFGHGCIIDQKRINGRLNQPGENSYKIEDSILDAIQLGNKNTIEKEVERFIEAIHNMSYKHAFIYSSQLLIAILHKFDNILSASNKDYENCYKIIYSFSDIETLDEVSAFIRYISFIIVEKLEEKKDSKNTVLLNHIQQLVKELYNDPNLSLDLIADKVHYSPGHLSKLFRSVTNTSFNDYVNSIRLEKAKELLELTNEPSTVISERVGLNNNTYFFTLFKKAYGMTPAQYRTQLYSTKE